MALEILRESVEKKKNLKYLEKADHRVEQVKIGNLASSLQIL